MKIFTIDGNISEGAKVERIKRPWGAFNAITVGEEGRGRHLGFLSAKLGVKEGETVTDTSRLDFSGLDLSDLDLESARSVLAVIRTYYGFRGGAEITGADNLPFPGKIIVEGQVADGIAGRMASAPQVIAILKEGDVFAVKRTGRLYGAPATLLYKVISGCRIVGPVIPEERRLAGI